MNEEALHRRNDRKSVRQIRRSMNRYRVILTRRRTCAVNRGTALLLNGLDIRTRVHDIYRCIRIAEISRLQAGYVYRCHPRVGHKSKAGIDALVIIGDGYRLCRRVIERALQLVSLGIILRHAITGKRRYCTFQRIDTLPVAAILLVGRVGPFEEHRTRISTADRQLFLHRRTHILPYGIEIAHSNCRRIETNRSGYIRILRTQHQCAVARSIGENRDGVIRRPQQTVRYYQSTFRINRNRTAVESQIVCNGVVCINGTCLTDDSAVRNRRKAVVSRPPVLHIRPYMRAIIVVEDQFRLNHSQRRCRCTRTGRQIRMTDRIGKDIIAQLRRSKGNRRRANRDRLRSTSVDGISERRRLVCTWR